MAHRNRWFTVLKNGWIFHGELLNNQRVLGSINPGSRGLIWARSRGVIGGWDSEILHHLEDGWKPVNNMGCLPPFSTGAGFRNHSRYFLGEDWRQKHWQFDQHWWFDLNTNVRFYNQQNMQILSCKLNWVSQPRSEQTFGCVTKILSVYGFCGSTSINWVVSSRLNTLQESSSANSPWKNCIFVFFSLPSSVLRGCFPLTQRTETFL